MNTIREFGIGDTSYQAAGREEGLRKLCEDFYTEMRTLPEAKVILDMHEEDLTVITDKLTLFLCGWLGGPKKFQEKYGSIHIPLIHKHLRIHEAERDAWLLCMRRALDKQPYSQEFKDYLNKQFFIPAERIRRVCNAED